MLKQVGIELILVIIAITGVLYTSDHTWTDIGTAALQLGTRIVSNVRIG